MEPHQIMLPCRRQRLCRMCVKYSKKLYNGETPEVFEKRGIKIFQGNCKFEDSHSVSVDGQRLTAHKFIVAAGSSPMVPKVEGLEEAGYYTNQTIFDIAELPKTLACIGGGPISMELAQAFNNLGVSVTVIQRSDILKNEDKELVAAFKKNLIESGVILKTGITPVSVVQSGSIKVLKVKDSSGAESEIKSEAILVATGRVPNTAGLELEKAGVEYDRHGIKVNKFLRTGAKNIYAIGDVVGPYRFSHIAEYHGAVAALNALLPIKRKVSYENIVWVNFTDPEIAHLGLTEEQARAKYGDKLKIFRYEYKCVEHP